MRTIKFRAWDTMQNKMVSLDPHKEGIISGNLTDLVTTDDWKVMQFTGLKDKSGKEIYEGDVVKGFMGKTERLLEVFFYEGKLKFCKRIIGRQKCSGLTNPSKRNCKWEVIGNIYENPDLLSGSATSDRPLTPNK